MSSNSNDEPAERSRSSELPPQVPDHEIFPRPIGSGSYGRVFLARNVMGTWRAVKVVYRSRFDSDRSYERDFEGVRRFEPVSRLHPSQLNILQIGRNDAAGYFYYVMELADNAAATEPPPSDRETKRASGTRLDPDSPLRGTLGECEVDPTTYAPLTLRSKLDQQGRLPYQECLDISLSLSLALARLHQHNLVHRDIKPSNIVLVNGIPKLADIGLVTAAGANTFVGTEGYLPPEGPGSRAADIFSLGRVMYEMMTGLDRTEFPKLPTGFQDFADHDQLVEFNKAVLRAAADASASRYRTAEELHEDLVLVQAGKGVRDLRAIAKRSKRLRLAAWILGCAAAVFGVVALLQWRVARTEQRAALVHQAEMLRMGDRSDAWRSNAFTLLRQAGEIRLDDEVRGQAVAALAGTECRAWLQLRGTAARHLAFDRDGGRLVLDGGGEGMPTGQPLSARDFANIEGFVRRLNQPRDPVSAYLARRLSPATRQALAQCTNTAGVPKTSQNRLLHDLEGVVNGEPIYERQRFAGVDLRPETLLALTDREEGELGTTVNRMLLENAYPGEICVRRRACVWDLRTRQCQEFVSTNTGPVWFDSEGRPCQFAHVGRGAFAIIDLEQHRVLHTLALNDEASPSTLRLTAQTVSYDGALYAACVEADSQGRLAVWDTRSARRIGLIARSCSALAFSPNGDCLALGNRTGKVEVLSLPGLQSVGLFQQDRLSINCLAVRPNVGEVVEEGKIHPWLLAAGDAGGVISLYDVSTGKLKKSFSGSHYSIRSMAFSPDGMSLVSGGSSTLRLWDIATGLPKATIGFDRAAALAFSPDGRTLAAGMTSIEGGSAVSQVIQIAQGPGLTMLDGLAAPCAKLAFSPNGRWLAALAHDWRVAVWDTWNHRLVRSLAVAPGRSADNAALAFSPDGRELAFATSGAASVWEVETGRPIRAAVPNPPHGLAQQLSYDAAGRLLLFQWEEGRPGTNGICRVRDLRAVEPTAVLSEFKPCRKILCSALSRDGRWAVVCAAGDQPEESRHSLEIFDPITGQRRGIVASSNWKSSDSFALDPNGTTLAYQDFASQQLRFYAIPGGQAVGSFPAFVRALGPGRHWLATLPRDSRGFELRRGDNVDWRLILRADAEVLAIEFSSDGLNLAWGAAGGAVYLCEIEETLQFLDREGLGWRRRR